MPTQNQMQICQIALRRMVRQNMKSYEFRWNIVLTGEHSRSLRWTFSSLGQFNFSIQMLTLTNIQILMTWRRASRPFRLCSQALQKLLINRWLVCPEVKEPNNGEHSECRCGHKNRPAAGDTHISPIRINQNCDWKLWRALILK